MKFITFFQKSIVLKSAILTVMAMAGFMIFASPKAAAVYNNIENVPGFIQTQMFNEDLGNCSGYRHAQFVWLSALGNNSGTTVYIDQGQDRVGLSLNTLAGQCNNNINGSGNIINTEIRTTRTRTNSASTNVGFISSGLVGSVADLSYTPSHFFNTKYVTGVPPGYAVLRTDFEVAGLAGLPVGFHTVTVTVDTTLVNQYVRANNTTDYICVTPKPDGSPHFATDLNGMGTDGIPCGRAGPTFDITVQVVGVDTPIQGGIDRAGCDIGAFVHTRTTNNQTYTTQAAITGSGQDKDYYYNQVHVYIDGVNPNDLAELQFVGSYDANNYPRSLNGTPITPPIGYGQPGYPDWHDWWVVPKADLDQFADAYQHTVRVFGIGKNKDGSNSGDNREIFLPGNTRIRLGNCAPVTCTAVPTQAPPQVNQPFGIEVTYIYSNPGSRGRPITPTVSASYNSSPASTFTFAPTRTGGSRVLGTYTQTSPGTYPINASVSQAGAYSANCNDTVNIANLPYVKVFGNDVAVGGKFADVTPTTCTGSPSISDASIWAFDKKVSANGKTFYGGASSQFGASALGKIDSFFSAGSRNNAAAPEPANGLSFGNMINNSLVTNYGGDSGLSRCIPDYYSASTNAAAGPDIRPNGAVIGSGETPGIGQQKAIFVNGDAFVSGNISFPTGGWTSPSQIPNFYLIAKGNIYIDDSVTSLDGTYIAQPDSAGNKGKIYTCTNGSALWPISQLADRCKATLTVNGSFIAKQVKYQRTNGTVESSIANGPSANPQLGLAWSSIGPISGQYCVQFLENSDPNTWYDNFLCSQNDLGLRFSGNLPIAGMTCINLNKPLPYPAAYTWHDNYLCWPPASNLGLTWSTSGRVAGRYCDLNVTEGVGNWGGNTFICEPIKVQPAYTPTNEVPTSGNIAEVFNFSQENYLAPTPTILRGVTSVGTGSSSRYEAITSLPPIL